MDYDKRDLQAKLQEYKDALQRREPGAEFLNVAVESASKHINSKTYIEYGVYWYAMKEVLANHGVVYGNNQTNVAIRDMYKQETEALTMVAAFEFRTFYNSYFMHGNRLFDLRNNGVFALLDEDMEDLGN